MVGNACPIHTYLHADDESWRNWSASVGRASDDMKKRGHKAEQMSMMLRRHSDVK
jgi:hypothetical protein